MSKWKKTILFTVTLGVALTITIRQVVRHTINQAVLQITPQELPAPIVHTVDELILEELRADMVKLRESVARLEKRPQPKPVFYVVEGDEVKEITEKDAKLIWKFYKPFPEVADD